MSSTTTHPFSNGPLIRQIATASWPSVDTDVRLPKPTVKRPVLNKVYFSKKVMTGKHKVYDPNGYADTVRVIWEIPFSVDVNEPVTELVQKIQAVMTAKKIYKHWDINMNTFIILASEETNELDYIRA